MEEQEEQAARAELYDWLDSVEESEDYAAMADYAYLQWLQEHGGCKHEEIEDLFADDQDEYPGVHQFMCLYCGKVFPDETKSK
jgi:Fe2+ or Zn2+ uptake regulation protein